MYLALCQRVARRAGIAGASPGKPDGVTGQPERLQLVCDYVAEAVREIETEYLDWTFMRPEIDFFVEANATAVDPHETQPDVLSINENAVFGRSRRFESQIHKMPWPELRRRRETTTDRIGIDAIPTYFATDPAGVIQLYPSSREGFVLRAEYTVAPAVMAEPDDVPHIPVTHHDAVFWRALALHYEADEADMLMRTAEARYAQWLARLEAAFLPNNQWSRTHSPEQQLTVVPE